MVGDKAALTYTIPMPSDGVTREAASVLEFVKSGVLRETRTLEALVTVDRSQRISKVVSVQS